MKNEKRTLNFQKILITLPYLKFIPDDKNLGFMLNSICNIGQTALLAETEGKGLALSHFSARL
ncbi:hypothetical protein FcAc13_06040 [Frischella sp. Ac13]|uniref:Uncharacterized protein n=1 Tax=Frischella japonica TaxID=2741544 RepID=A0ABR7QXB6_9GAMM|nr:hypothetical protein [Frischella japonica]MBC9130868.1 hypothetical protein [Frischella japonica]